MISYIQYLVQQYRTLPLFMNPSVTEGTGRLDIRLATKDYCCCSILVYDRKTLDEIYRYFR